MPIEDISGNKLSRRLLRATARQLIKRLWLGPVNGLEHIPARGPAILIANHSSYLDFLVLGAMCELQAGRPVHFWANRKITRSHPLFRHLAAICEAIPVERGVFSGEVWQRSLDYLAQGRLLAIFPEGTRSRDGRLQPFQPGYLKLAARSGAPIIPVNLTGAYDILPPQQRWPRLNGKCAITLHPPVHLPGPGAAKGTLAELNHRIFAEYYGGEVHE